MKKSSSVTFRVDEEIREALESLAIWTNRDRGEVCRIILTAFMVENKERVIEVFEECNQAVARWKMQRVHLSDEQLQQMRDTLKTPKRERKSGA